MPSKKQPIRPNSDKVWKRLFIALLLSVIIGGILLLNSYLNQQAEQKEKITDDIKFAKIETYINAIKVNLDREIPEGNWKIAKSCSAPSTKGDFEEYSCEYGIESNSETTFKDTQLAVARKFSSKDLYVSESGVTFGMYVDIKKTGCSTYYERDAINVSGFRCSSGSHGLRYPLE